MQQQQPEASPEEQSRADVDALANLPGKPVQLGQHSFHVRPMKVRQFFPFLALARPLFAALVKRPSSPPSDLPPAVAGHGQGGAKSKPAPPPPDPLHGGMEAALADAEWVLDVLGNHGPQVIEALAVGIEPDDTKQGQVLDDIGDLELGHLVTLLKHFVVVNADFFAQQGLKLPAGLLLPQGLGASASPATP